MERLIPLEHVTTGLAKAQSDWKTPRTQQTPALTIAIARQAGTPGTSVAQEVGRRLGWTVYDRELLEHIAKEHGLRLSLLESVDEKPQGWMRQSFQSLFGVPTLSEHSYMKHVVETILSLGKLGHCVLVGRGAPHILPDASTLRVRLVGPLESRVEAYQRRYNLSAQEAARKVDTIDRDRAAFVKEHFRQDLHDPTFYDLVLNTGRWSVEECGELIAAAARRLEGRSANQGERGVLTP
jgi:cytidylate kinase